MAIVQEAFDIPEEIMTKILCGEYRRTGGVIRYASGSNKGQIVKHLDPINISATTQAKKIKDTIVFFAKNNKKLIMISGTIVAISALGAVKIYNATHKGREEYAIKLAAGNDILPLEKGITNSEENVVIDLQNYLANQHMIFTTT